MKLFVRGLSASGLLLAVLIFTGCNSLEEMPAPPKTHDGGKVPSTAEVAQVAHFHVGDTINITFSGMPSTDQLPPHEETIKEDGSITLPLIGPIQAVGKTAGELQDEIHTLYVPQYYVRLNITVTGGANLIYYVRGEVRQPGREAYIGETTVTKAITSAGDFTDFASHNVSLIRANGTVIKVDVDKALANPALDLRIYPGDQIWVPRRIF
jgi:polysaccharide export outer membrane protein